jgi:hypothetical protein
MNSHCVVQVLLSYTLKDSHRETLSDLSRMWTQEMETDNLSSLCLVHHNLSIAILFTLVIQVPLQRLIDTSVSHNIFSSEFLNCVLLTVSATTVLDRSEDSSRDKFITHLSCSSPKQPCS